MMLYPAMKDLLEKIPSRYELVNVVAHRAREIAAEAEAAGEPLDEIYRKAYAKVSEMSKI